MSAPLRIAMNLAAAAALAAALLLGALWLGDRAHRWERPRWEGGSFVPLRAGPRVVGEAQPLWVVPVNPRCRHCLTTLRRLHVAWARQARPEELIALIVDTRARPPAALLRAVPPVPVWWDRRGIWRRRWGHRLYGELIQFDATGRFVRTAAAGEVLRSARRPAPTQPSAPATSPGEVLPSVRRPAPMETSAPATSKEGGT